jgi:RimJ/RimL family protein N-acetyltransferase
MLPTLKRSLRAIAHLVLGEYSPYYVYRWVPHDCQSGLHDEGSFEVRLLDDSTLTSAQFPLIRDQAWYSGPESLCFGYFFEGRLVGLCAYWYGERYKLRNFWPLEEREAKLVQIVVVPEMRGRGIATTLIDLSAREMVLRRFQGLYARIWHSNLPSIQAFERAGWKRIAFVVEINPFRNAKPFRIHIRKP